MEVSFKAQFLDKCNVLKYNNNTKSFTQTEVSFIEIDAKNWRDKRALKKTSKIWKESLAKNIYQSQRDNRKSRVFAITEQNSDFKHLDAKKFLGLSQVKSYEPNVYYIEHLQTNPEYTMDKHDRAYKKIGSTILDNLKKLFKKDTLRLSSLCDDEIIDFYIKNNFKFEKFYLGDLIWIDKFEKNNL